MKGFCKRTEQLARSRTALQKQPDDASAARTIGAVAILVCSGIALNGGAMLREPKGAAGNLGLQTSAAHCPGAAAVLSEQHASAGLAVTGTLEGDDRS